MTNTNDSISVEPDEPNELAQLIDYFSKAIVDSFDSPDGTDNLNDMIVLDSLYKSDEQDERVEPLLEQREDHPPTARFCVLVYSFEQYPVILGILIHEFRPRKLYICAID